jgi:exonuclease SbcD
MKIAHFSDLHYCAKHLKWVDKAFSFAVNDAIERGAEVALLSGDSFDSSIGLHELPVAAFLQNVKRLADSMPVAVLAGTQSHDRPGSLDVLHTIGGKYPVLVADTIGQAAWDGEQWQYSSGFGFSETPVGTRFLLSCLPSVNKGEIAARAGVEKASQDAGEIISELLQGWAPSNLRARSEGIANALMTHGTVNGAVTECAHALVSQDHEFSAGALFSAQASAVCIGHIHAHQQFEQDGRRIAYPGSITRLIFGHMDPTGYLFWDVQPARADFEFVPTPAKRLLQAEFDGPPDMGELRELAAEAEGAHVRVRAQVDEDHRHAVDRAAIKALFDEAGAEVCKIEIRVNPIVRTRADGISTAHTLSSKLEKWCEVTDTESAPLVERLRLLESLDDTDKIIQSSSENCQGGNDGQATGAMRARVPGTNGSESDRGERVQRRSEYAEQTGGEAGIEDGSENGAMRVGVPESHQDEGDGSGRVYSRGADAASSGKSPDESDIQRAGPHEQKDFSEEAKDRYEKKWEEALNQ